MLKIITGQTGSGKSYSVLKEMAQAYEQNRTDNIILLIPEQFSLEASASFMEKMGQRGHIHMDVLSFQRLAHRVFEETGATDRVRISELGKNMLLRQIFERQAAQLKVYGKMAGRSGFMDSVNRLISEFKRAQIKSEDLERQIEDMEDGLLRRKLEDIVYLYEAFETQMSGGYFDDEDVLELLIEKIDEAKFLKGAKIWVDGFNGFTAQEYVILQKLMKRVEAMTLALTYEEGDGGGAGIYSSTGRTLERVLSMADETGVKYEIEKLKPQRQAQAIQHLGVNLFTYPLDAFKGNSDSIGIFACQSRHSEVERAGREIVRLAREKGYKWREIAVVTPDIQDYSMNIKRSFSSMNIPYFLDEKRSIMNSPLVQYILGLLRFFAYGFKYDDAFRTLKTGLSPLDAHDVLRLENYVLAYGISRGGWWKPFSKGTPEEVEAAELPRLQWTEHLAPLKKKLGSAKTIREISTELYLHMERSGLHERLSDFTQALSERGLLDQANESAQIWNAALEILDQLVELIGEDEIALKDYIKLVETGFSSIEIGVIPPARDRVLVGNLERSRSHDIKALFVIGVNDGKLPMVSESGGVLSDLDKMTLKASGLPIKSDYQTLSEEEQLAITQTLSKPSEVLSVSFAMSDSDGKSLRPSILIDRMKTVVPGLKIEVDASRDPALDFERIATPESTLQVLIEGRRALADSKRNVALWDDVAQWYLGNEAYAHRYKMIEKGFDHRNQVGSIGRSMAAKLYGTPLRSSVSRFEKYVQCPFAHFVSYGLKPEQRRLYEIHLPDLGTIYHESVERFSRELEKEQIQWKALEKADCDRIIDSIIDEVAGGYGHNVFESSKRYIYLLQRVKRVGRRAAWTITEQIRSGAFSPTAYELAFREGGGPDSVPPILLELPGGETILLEGRIDRIDVFDDGEHRYVNIIDYKSGSRRFHLSDVFYGLQIQLVVYLDAVMQNAHYLKADSLLPGGMFYFKIDDPMIESDAYDPESIEAQIRQALKMDGLAVRDVSVLKTMDQRLEPGSRSDVIPVELKKDGEVSSRSSAVDAQDFKLLIEHVRSLMGQIGQEIVGGRVKIEPCRYSGTTSCDFCPYRGICQFDQLFENNRYRYMKKKKDEEVLEEIRATQSGHEDGEVDSNDKMDK